MEAGEKNEVETGGCAAPMCRAIDGWVAERGRFVREGRGGERLYLCYVDVMWH